MRFDVCEFNGADDDASNGEQGCAGSRFGGPDHSDAIEMGHDYKIYAVDGVTGRVHGGDDSSLVECRFWAGPQEYISRAARINNESLASRLNHPDGLANIYLTVDCEPRRNAPRNLNELL